MTLLEDSGTVGTILVTGGILAVFALLRGARCWKTTAGGDVHLDGGKRVVASLKEGNPAEQEAVTLGAGGSWTPPMKDRGEDHKPKKKEDEVNRESQETAAKAKVKSSPARTECSEAANFRMVCGRPCFK